MAHVLFANAANLVHIDRLLTDIFNACGQSAPNLGVDSYGQMDYHHKIQILVLNRYNPDFDLQKALDSIVSNGVIIMNADELSYAGIKLTRPMRLITYGYNPKSTITASSVVVHENISLQCCIQRQFDTLCGAALEPQEFSVRTSYMELKEDDVLAAVTIALLSSVPAHKISNMKPA